MNKGIPTQGRNTTIGWIRFWRVIPHSEAAHAGAIGVLTPEQIEMKPISQTRCERHANTEKRTEMTAERHNAPQNLHANPSGNAGDCPTIAHSSLPWRRLRRFFATMVLASFVLNEIWEIAQMSFYVETAGHSWTSTIGLCTRAAVGDVGIILAICAAGALAAGDPGWGLRGMWNVYATAALLGLVCATLVEHAALASGRWSYMERMPVVPVLAAGLWPLLQMTLLPPLTIWIAQWWVWCCATKGALK